MTTCKGKNCTATPEDQKHSDECRAEHDATVFEAAMADHINHGGWKCEFCGYNGQNNQPFNRFCSSCHRSR